jgi:hypothetical protein
VIFRRYEPRDRDAVQRLHHSGLDQMGANLGSGPWDADLDAIEEIIVYAKDIE